MGVRLGTKEEPYDPTSYTVSSEETYYFVPVAFRGDLKYLTQCFNFVRNASSEQDCTSQNRSCIPIDPKAQVFTTYWEIFRCSKGLVWGQHVEIKVWVVLVKTFLLASQL